MVKTIRSNWVTPCSSLDSDQNVSDYKRLVCMHNPAFLSLAICHLLLSTGSPSISECRFRFISPRELKSNSTIIFFFVFATKHAVNTFIIRPFVHFYT